MADRVGLMEGFVATLGIKREKHRGKHATIVREGEAIVEDVDPKYASIAAKNAGQGTSSSGFPKGPVASGTVEKPQR